MFLYSKHKGNDCIWKLQCHCIQILHLEIYSVEEWVSTKQNNDTTKLYRVIAKPEVYM